MKLNYNLHFEDLYTTDGCVRIDKIFQEYLNTSGLLSKLEFARTNPLLPKEESDLILEFAPHLEDFLAKLFNIETEVTTLSEAHDKLAPIYKCKRLFIQRQAAKCSYDKIEEATSALIKADVNLHDELDFSIKVNKAVDDNNLEMLEAAKVYGAWALFSEDGKKKHKNGVLFKIPKKLDFNRLIDTNEIAKGHQTSKHFVDRKAFELQDKGGTLEQIIDQANYCIHCHNQGKDSCSKGFKDKDSGKYKVNDLSVTLAGCPLEEKISEMNLLKTQGSVIGALATAIVDNPMLPVTGHRICNDCMKGCIYQKQDPVNIPLIETGTLNNVLDLPWGFEIYSLLTRWNPLNFKRPYPKEDNNKKILVAGLGPSGFTLSHHLLNEGFIVVGIEGLKIEPLDSDVSGIDIYGKRHAFKPIKNVRAEIFEDLNTRKAYGFGGVAEYGITVRWDKNYLKLVRLVLERRNSFRMYGGVRFGGTITYNKAWELGFDHIALCLGAGKPNLLDIPNTLARGVRTASDFLMSLQLTGAAREESLANLQLRLPVVVIGGGLTAIDTVTESLAYYPVQVEKFLKKYEAVGDSYFESLNEEEKIIANEFISHAKELRANPANKLDLLRKWGGAKIAYRKELKDSPAYRLNHEEVDKAFEEGIEFIENITPTSIELDKFGHVKSLRHEAGEIEAKTVFMAIGTNPNITLTGEEPESFKLDGKFFQTLNLDGNKVSPERVSKPKEVHILTSKEGDKSVSFFGDLHPSFNGNVVKAMASAKQGYPIISKLLSTHQNDRVEASDFFRKLDNQLLSYVERVERLTPTIIEVLVKAPLAANEFKPGQFYRLQNYEHFARKEKGVVLATEGLALTGAWVDKEKGLLSTIVLEMGGSSNLCQFFKQGEPIVLMGPTGTPTEIPHNKTVMLVGGGLGNAVLFSIGKAMKEQGCKVIYFAGYKKAIDRYKVEEIEAASDVVIWCCDELELSKNREQDISFKGNIVQAIECYASKNTLVDVERMIVIGSDRMMAAVTYARHNSLKQYFKNDHIAIGSINSPMQCMMKEICGQCIQRHYNEVTGEETYVYSCNNQDQELDLVDFKHLEARLKQNKVQEMLCGMYLAKIIRK